MIAVDRCLIFQESVVSPLSLCSRSMMSANCFLHLSTSLSQLGLNFNPTAFSPNVSSLSCPVSIIVYFGKDKSYFAASAILGACGFWLILLAVIDDIDWFCNACVPPPGCPHIIHA